MVSTLQELCYRRLAKQMVNAPPGLQEIIMGETKKRMEERITKEITAKKQENLADIRYMIPDIMEDLIRVIVTPGALRNDYFSTYAFASPNVVQCAVQAAEEAVRRMEERYVHPAFPNHNAYEDYEEDSEGMYM